MSAQQLSQTLTNAIINPLLLLLFSAALIVFIWGIIQFLIALSNGGDTGQGKIHMLWGIVGLVIMVSAYAIIQVVTNTIGVPIPL